MKRSVGWRKEPARHALAAKGVKTKPARGAAMNVAMVNGPTDEEAQAWAWEHYKENWNGLGSKEMDEFYAEWERDHTGPNPASGGVRYCGYVIGEEISPEQVERLYHFLHANYTAEELIMMGNVQLHEIAEDNEEEWKW